MLEVCAAWVALTWPQAIVLILFGPVVLFFAFMLVVLAVVLAVFLLLVLGGGFS